MEFTTSIIKETKIEKMTLNVLQYIDEQIQKTLVKRT